MFMHIIWSNNMFKVSIILMLKLVKVEIILLTYLDSL